MDLTTLIKKTGHRLAEVRERALRNLLCKLEHGLLSVPDLAQEKLLLINLLEWFNFPEVPVPEQALQLLATLAEHPSAAQTLADVGAVEFLTQLCLKVESRLRPVIDGVLNQLFHLPDVPTDFPTQKQRLGSSDAGAVAFTHSVNDESPLAGYFLRSPCRPRQSHAPSQSGPASGSIKCLKFSTFPWLALTTTDRHILASNESSLRSSDYGLVQAACDLLQDVIMQDFPAEIFLQRPTIVQNLLSLLSVSSGGPTGDLALRAVACLQQLCGNLRSRLRFHRDPSFHSVKQDTVSQNSSMSYSQDVRGARLSTASSPEEGSPRPSVVGRTGQRARGDGQDGDVASSSSGSSHRGTASGPPPQSLADVAQMDTVEDVVELQLRQFSVAQLGAAVLERVTPLLQTESMEVFLRVLDLLSVVLPLLASSVSGTVWEDSSLIGLDLKEKLLRFMEHLGDVLQHHGSGSSDTSGPLLVHHRMAYMGTAVFTIRLLQTLIPVEKAGDNLPESTSEALFLLCMDTPFSLAFPGIHESAVAYLEQASPDKHHLYGRTRRAAQFVESTCAFIREAHAQQGEGSWVELLELADQAIDGFPYHKHLPVIKKCVQICSSVWKLGHPSPELQKESLNVFLKFLAHPIPSVKVETYACTLNIVKDCLGVQNATKPAFPACLGVNFLLNACVLYEISAFGLQDQAERVRRAARDILLFLLKGRLIMSDLGWDRLTQELLPVIPILQGYADTKDALGTCVLLISEPSSETASNPARTRAAIRLLFTKSKAVRAAAIHHLTPILTGAEGSSARPVLTQDVLSLLPSLYIVNRPVDLKLNDTDRSFLKEECANKLFGVLTSETVDLLHRKSAAEQLGVILQDTAMHSVLKRLGITEKLISFLEDSVSDNTKNMDSLLGACFCMLRKLVYADPVLRLSLGQRTTLLITLLRASLIIKENGGDVSEAAVLMCLLLFDEVARPHPRTEDSNPPVQAPFSLPVSVMRRFSFPFRAAVHHAVSPYCTVVPPYSDLLALRPAWEMLQFAWNRAWYSTVETLLGALEGHQSDVPEFLDDLRLSASQGLLLRVTHTQSGLQDCLHRIRTADSHAAVSEALAGMRFYLLADRLAVKPDACSGVAVLRSLGFHGTIERFLQVLPACTEDEKLLVDVVLFLRAFFQPRTPGPDAEDLRWLLDLLVKPTGTLLTLLVGVESPERVGGEDPQVRVNQKLQKELTALFCTLLNILGLASDRTCLTLSGAMRTQLATRLLRCLKVSDAPRFYGLPSLERTLRAMVCVSALPGWSSHSAGLEPWTLCLKYLSGLLEVISSFYVEWGGNSMSFMGKGVTKNAVLCLLHLSHEMIAEGKDAEWVSLWSLAHELPEEPVAQQLSLAWLVPLWVDRDPEVRFASLGIGAALTAAEKGCHALAASCRNISGGLWATLLTVLMDQQECSMVRREAAFILQNLLVMPMPARMDEARDCPWQGPCVHDEVSGLSLAGLPALQALLYHCQFFELVSQTVRSCFQGRYSFQLDFPGSQECDEGADLERQWRVPSAALNRSDVSSSQSTCSTLIHPEELCEDRKVATSSSPTAAPEASTRLLAQGQSDADTSDSAASQDSQHGEPASQRAAIVTPHLVSAICGLLANLVAILPEFTLGALRHHRILSSLTSLVDAGTIERCVCELRTLLHPGSDEDASSQVQGLLQFLSSYAKLLQSCVISSADLLSAMEPEIQPLLGSTFIVLTLDIRHLDASTRETVLHTWGNLFTLLATMLKKDSSAVFPSVSTAMGRRWQPFVGTISLCVELSPTEPALCSASMTFLCAILTEESRRCARCGPETPLSQVLKSAPGDQLCETLLQCFEKTSFQDPLKKVTSRALLSLLASSRSAQSHACRAGLVGEQVERLKHVHCQLDQESLTTGKCRQKKKEESCLKELKMVLQLLRNCLYRNEECKMAACDSSLASMVNALWPWLLQVDGVMEPALELLCVFTANCAPACSSLCWSIAGQAAVQRGPAGGSLMHGVMKLATLLAPENSSLQRLAFSLLANLAASRDCKGVMQKSNFFQHFPPLSLPKPGSKTPSPTLSLWLKLLLNASFSEDGQQMILKMDGSLELLSELSLQGRDVPRPSALLVLHNVSFCSANKPKVLASGKAVGVLVSCLESDQPNVRAIGASALWALLHNYQKAKVTLKSPSIRIKAEEAYISAQRDVEQHRDDPVNSYLLKCLEKLTQLLNH